MISLIMATYNGEKYIVEQMESIRRQTLQPDEVIICDDHSTDKTLTLMQEYVKKYKLNWSIILNEKNLGY